ncbi:unnamed protein product [Trichogramma brassicae]|uniref:Uncharacterized protein n=1 Tax=Trichogramma brassicae TaxID=86971 RepID=A0A6H5I1Z9_9HYME|nr:unnamed protein product [Trichogramma brassicae]
MKLLNSFWYASCIYYYYILKHPSKDDDELAERVIRAQPRQVSAAAGERQENNSGERTAAVCSEAGHKKLTEILLRQGANPNFRQTTTEMTLFTAFALNSADVDLLRMFYDINEELHQTVHTNAKDKHGRDTVYLALHRDMRQMVKFLLMAGADPQYSLRKKGVTPLHVVATSIVDSSSLATILLRSVPSEFRPLQINPQDKLGNKPLHMAMAATTKTGSSFGLARTAPDRI